MYRCGQPAVARIESRPAESGSSHPVHRMATTHQGDQTVLPSLVTLVYIKWFAYEKMHSKRKEDVVECKVDLYSVTKITLGHSGAQLVKTIYIFFYGIAL